ncbi:PREDICTED: putative uncharacterized protein encoded by ZNF503-AS2 isoform X2 [Colobus angolensis palliatus]|uniref:putative uncharacterized protein encoded by ZNF503-AS2 isoform X2 n=1 Tax=Colobus angolensis palliatus TaxID=336983 RepID=UPI0005F48F4E|nr:PREDICTED: putative uncharacterized protein encoded by ZNF503-AS2 isoform X2 [Colobus angolensis palliatus]
MGEKRLRPTHALSPTFSHLPPSPQAGEPGIDGISLAVVCAAFIRINPARRHPAGNGSGSRVRRHLGPTRDSRWLLVPGRLLVRPPREAGQAAPPG